MTPRMGEWLVAFAATVLLEWPVYRLALRDLPGWKHRGMVVLALNAVTHPGLWFVAPTFDPFPLWLGLMETLVVLTEGVALFVLLDRLGYLYEKTRARGLGGTMLVALGANAVSTLAGLLWWGW